jgi:hypothetical protein
MKEPQRLIGRPDAPPATTPSVAYTRDTVLTSEEVRLALRMGQSDWKKKRHAFPFSFILGPRKARITWGQVVDVIESTNIDALAARRRRGAR